MLTLGISNSNLIAISGVAVNGVALIMVAFSIRELRKATDATRDVMLLTLNQNLAVSMAELNRYFVDHPEYRPFFHGGKDAGPDHPDHDRLLAIAEMILDFMDNALAQLPMMRRPEQIDDWRQYFAHMYWNSPVLRRYWSQHGEEWYGNGLIVEIMRDIEAAGAPPSRT